MAGPKRLVLFVEGDGDRDAVPILIRQLLTERSAWEHLFLDPNPFVVGNVADITKGSGKDWTRYLQAVQQRKNLGAVLLLWDGESDTIRKEPFCAGRFAARLAEWSRTVGAGIGFSVACVFVCQEYESWFLACVSELAGQQMSDGRDGVKPGALPPGGDLEISPRDAKKALGSLMASGYKPTRDQAEMTRLMVNHLSSVRSKGLRSFQRLEKAVTELIEANTTGQHLVSPICAQPAQKKAT